ncbi:MAG TPA: urea ABC transporter permease subunit UrtC [Alphaproteobacteria bacterium]|nr:urea ABC transporter permease subunit UrtC [Alphaproteobacteria bacterium]
MTVTTSRPRIWLTEAVLGVLLIVILPTFNALGLLSDYYLNLCGKYLSLAMLALGMDLIWGYAGILSLGQAVFFGLGAYSMGMYLMLGSSGQGVYGEPIPDFMVWNRVVELPLFWKPFQYFPCAVLSALLLPALAAALLGALTFRRRVSGTYFAILTQAIAYAAWLLFNRNELNLGGTNGLTDFKHILGLSLGDPGTLRGLYAVTAACLVGSLVFCRWLTRSRLGLVLTAIRDQEQRLRFLGYPVAHYKIFIFAAAAMLSGLAGALYVPQVGIITPSQIGVLPSLEVVVWVAAGGRGTLIGALLGAIGINAARSLLTAHYPEWWPVILGGLFVGVVIAFPDGLVGLPRQLQRLGRALYAWLSAPKRVSPSTVNPGLTGHG